MFQGFSNFATDKGLIIMPLLAVSILAFAIASWLGLIIMAIPIGIVLIPMKR
jgi:hypothetical protein